MVRDHTKTKASNELKLIKWPTGVAAPLVSITAVRTLSFSVYQKAKYKASSVIGDYTGVDEPLRVVNQPGSLPTWGTVLCFGTAGAIAGAASTFLACKSEFRLESI